MKSQDIPWPARARGLLIWLITALLSIAILVMRLPLSGQVALQVGDVARSDVTAPRQITYISAIRTQDRKSVV